MTDQALVARNVEQQTRWYGEPLGQRVHRLLARASISQTEFAAVIGLSAPMLSLLMSGQRAKISNPAVLNRLRAAEDLVASADFENLSPRDRKQQLDNIRHDQPTTVEVVLTRQATATGDPVQMVQALLRATASAADIEAAAIQLDTAFPRLAMFLRVYGNDRTDRAREHFDATMG